MDILSREVASTENGKSDLIQWFIVIPSHNDGRECDQIAQHIMPDLPEILERRYMVIPLEIGWIRPGEAMGSPRAMGSSRADFAPTL
jgi:hypothetical protein